jgi:hypothetical protein
MHALCITASASTRFWDVEQVFHDDGDAGRLLRPKSRVRSVITAMSGRGTAVLVPATAQSSPANRVFTAGESQAAAVPNLSQDCPIEGDMLCLHCASALSSTTVQQGVVVRIFPAG